jgi:hypothetical protein
VQENDFDSTIASILDSINPEIHHYRHDRHPGYKWYIKTIIPGQEVLTECTYQIYTSWQDFCNRHANIACLTNIAYDWQGQIIQGWWTLWLDTRIDVKWSWQPDQHLSCTVVDFAEGLQKSGIESRDWLLSLAQSRQSFNGNLCFDSLLQIANFVKTWTNETQSRKNREKFKVIDLNEKRDEEDCR